MLVCLIGVPVSGSAAESLEVFVDRVIAVYGGKDALSRARTVRQTGQTVSLTRGGATATLTRVFQRPDKLRVEIAFPGEQVEVRILNGTQGWRRNSEISGPMYKAMLLQAARIAMPLLLLEEMANLKDLGTEAGPGGALFRVLQLPLRSDLALFVLIDVETGRIRHSRGSLYADERPIMEFATTYANFQSWNGILVAGREEQYAMGRHVGHTRIEKVEVLASVAPEDFRP
ncbi:MAG: hypothetical protein OEU09_13115 [Rhodospirillales bacterium]|nr:hypothetical protein [Rhodospirillales bacterium]MDH3912227.1 hypothetical protein [Rhodospirillales bacterium]MDH3918109.1 hypothetical protein [Rhodospirillales bacterium]MDH3966279.1 hypothetical protein [Rhodospirillales bacterium]